jgi:succinate dehydrogenase flavin-adding protein (antitoxin of CptAB toxin-antitoxin module)
MKNFGLLKSKIENVLLESYSNNTFKNEITTFKKLVLENKNISNLYYLYDELNSPKSLNESFVNDYINECIKMYENTVNKIKSSDIQKINLWVGKTIVENSYSNIDNLLSTDVLTIESKLKSRNLIKETLKKIPTIKSDNINLPLTTMVNVANKTIKSYIDSLNESDKKELINLLNEDDEKLNLEFNEIQKDIVNKLTEMKSNNNNDTPTLNRIDETLSKVISEKYNKLSYFKLKGLKEIL